MRPFIGKRTWQHFGTSCAWERSLLFYGKRPQKWVTTTIQRSRVALVQGDCQCLDTLRTEVDQKLDVLFQRWVWGFHQGFSHVVRKFVVLIFKLTNDATRMWSFIKLKGLIFMKPMDSKQHAWKKRFCNHMSCWSCSVNHWREFPWFEKKAWNCERYQHVFKLIMFHIDKVSLISDDSYSCIFLGSHLEVSLDNRF